MDKYVPATEALRTKLRKYDKAYKALSDENSALEAELQTVKDASKEKIADRLKYGKTEQELCELHESKIILVDGVHEPIVSKETFAKAAERLKKNVAHRKTQSDSTTVYPLTGLIRCPDCGKNIFGYTAPPRKKKNGKEGYYPRYISYRCISGRDRNGISCSLANKYYSGTKLETEVKEVISSMVTIPEFVELISQKIDIQTDVNSLRKKQTAIRNVSGKAG